eukprot:GABV01008630.1.p1 GENE.GABV01008630.1~~GABV01008630.1.p1  ORF type:complete len:415 (-),score=123.44 GABV01008630.1:61-1128(-)
MQQPFSFLPRRPTTSFLDGDDESGSEDCVQPPRKRQRSCDTFPSQTHPNIRPSRPTSLSPHTHAARCPSADSLGSAADQLEFLPPEIPENGDFDDSDDDFDPDDPIDFTAQPPSPELNVVSPRALRVTSASPPAQPLHHPLPLFPSFSSTAAATCGFTPTSFSPTNTPPASSHRANAPTLAPSPPTRSLFLQSTSSAAPLEESDVAAVSCLTSLRAAPGFGFQSQRAPLASFAPARRSPAHKVNEKNGQVKFRDSPELLSDSDSETTEIVFPKTVALQEKATVKGFIEGLSAIVQSAAAGQQQISRLFEHRVPSIKKEALPGDVDGLAAVLVAQEPVVAVERVRELPGGCTLAES